MLGRLQFVRELNQFDCRDPAIEPLCTEVDRICSEATEYDRLHQEVIGECGTPLSDKAVGPEDLQQIPYRWVARG